MQILFARYFKKSLQKQDEKIITAFFSRLELFEKDPRSTILQIHNLKGKYAGYKTFNVTGDFRVVYKMLDSQSVYIVNIGSHSELYR